jgi:hypothetical protein
MFNSQLMYQRQRSASVRMRVSLKCAGPLNKDPLKKCGDPPCSGPGCGSGQSQKCEAIQKNTCLRNSCDVKRDRRKAAHYALEHSPVMGDLQLEVRKHHRTRAYRNRWSSEILMPLVRSLLPCCTTRRHLVVARCLTLIMTKMISKSEIDEVHASVAWEFSYTLQVSRSNRRIFK